MSDFHIACGPDAPIWDAHLDGADVPGAYYCAVCDTTRAYVITTHGVDSAAARSRFFYGHCSICGHSVFLGSVIDSWLPGPALADVLAAEVTT
jgi:hypothetical protein